MRDNNAKAHNPKQHLPPPIGVHHEQPITTTEALKQIIRKDPDYARWVLFRSEELMQKLDALFAHGTDPRDTNIKERIAALLIEAREIQEVIRQNHELRKLFTH